jgi:hypothetical protein
VEFTTLHQQLYTAQFAEFIIRINSTELDGISTRIMLRKVQLRAGFLDCILTIDPAMILSTNLSNNFNFNVLKAMKDQLFNFSTIVDYDSWKLNSKGLTIISIL